MKDQKVYEGGGERGGWMIHESKTGYVIEMWSRNQGSMTSQRWLVRFSDRWPRGMDLSAPANDPGMTLGDCLAFEATGGQCLRKGYRVQ